MKKILSSIVFCTLFSYSHGKQSLSNPNDGMLPGMGYSSDRLARAATICYKPLTVTTSGQNSIVNFDTANDISKIINTFNVETSFKAGYGSFSANAMFKYFKSLENDDHSFSLNYYQKVAQTKNITYPYGPDRVLTEDGKTAYKNGTNPMFRLVCGDKFVDSYEEGAALILSMKVILGSRAQKEKIEASMGGKYGSFVEVSAKLQQAAEQEHLSGRIQITGFQLGGAPTQLSSMLTSRVIECGIKNVAACQETAKALIDYAAKTFPTQFTRRGDIWESPLSTLGGLKEGNLVSDFDVRLHPTYITPEVRKAREILIDAQNLNTATETRFKKTLTEFPAGEEVIIALTPEQRIKLDALLKNVSYNLTALATGFEYGKALECWSAPDRCILIRNTIIANLRNIIDNTITPTTCRKTNLYTEPGFCVYHGTRYDLRGGQGNPYHVQLNKIVFNDQTVNSCQAFLYIAGTAWLPCENTHSYEPTKW